MRGWNAPAAARKLQANARRTVDYAFPAAGVEPESVHSRRQDGLHSPLTPFKHEDCSSCGNDPCCPSLPEPVVLDTRSPQLPPSCAVRQHPRLVGEAPPHTVYGISSQLFSYRGDVSSLDPSSTTKEVNPRGQRKSPWPSV